MRLSFIHLFINWLKIAVACFQAEPYHWSKPLVTVFLVKILHFPKEQQITEFRQYHWCKLSPTFAPALYVYVLLCIQQRHTPTILSLKNLFLCEAWSPILILKETSYPRTGYMYFLLFEYIWSPLLLVFHLQSMHQGNFHLGLGISLWKYKGMNVEALIVLVIVKMPERASLGEVFTSYLGMRWLWTARPYVYTIIKSKGLLS